jgi:hypothetical protein
MATAIYDYAKNMVGGLVMPYANEMVRILPDSLLYGTGLMSLITYQTPMLFLFITVALGFVASNYLTSSLTSLFPDAIPPAVRSPACTTGLYSPTLTFLSLWKAGSAGAFPAAPLFVVSTFVFYCLSSLIQQSDVLKELGDEYAAKIPIVGTFSALLLILILTYFMYNGCNGFMTLLFSIGAGGLFGGLLSVLFSSLFGQEAINILGLPLFVRRDKVGKPLYICALKK